MKKNNQIKIGALLSYTSIAVNILAGLLYTPWMVKQIGKSDYGLYTLANSLITLFLLDFGLSSATARYVSKYHAEGNEEKVNEFLGAIYKLYLLIDALILIVLTIIYFLIDTIYVKLTPDELSKFKVVYLIAASFSIINFPFITLNGILTAYEKFIQQKLADLIYRFLVVGLMVYALLTGHGLYSVVTVNAIAGLIIIFYKLIIIRKFTSVRVKFSNQNMSIYKDIFSFSLWTTVISLSQRLIFSITPTILGVVSNSSEIAVFGIITTIEGYSFTVTSAINGMFMPKISRIYTQENPEDNIMPLMMKVGRFQYVLNGLIIVGFAVLGRFFISIWMGADYSNAYWGILLVIVPGIFFNALQIANTTAVVTNNVKYQALVNLGIGIINVVLSFAFSALWGVIGSCISIFVAYSIRAVALNILYYKKLRIDTPFFAKNCYLKMSIPVIISLVIGCIICSFIPNKGWISLGIQAIIVCAEYLIVMFFLGISKDERSTICKLLLSKIRRK